MIGQRIRRARLAAGLTQAEVVNRLSITGVALTKAGLSKYELGGSTPGANVVLRLAKILNVRAKSLVEEPSVHIEWLSFRKNATLGIKEQDRIKAIASDVIEKQVPLYETLHGATSPTFPKRVKVTSPDDAENVAAKLRESWGLGYLPLASVTGVIEDNGGIVVHIPDGPSNFHGLSGLANNKYPIAITTGEAPSDRTRFTLAHELGHLLMDSDELSYKESESLAHRFAAAFIVPPKIARMELGEHRKDISFSELAALKRKYGLSMQAWVYRAKDLNIIGERHTNALWRKISAAGWRKKEPAEFEGNEKPRKLFQMTMRALAEGIISESEARHLCPDFQKESEMLLDITIQRGVTPIEVLRMSREKRQRILIESSKIMEGEYEKNEELKDFDVVIADFCEDEPNE